MAIFTYQPQQKTCCQVDPPSVEESREVSGTHPMEVWKTAFGGMMVVDFRGRKSRTKKHMFCVNEPLVRCINELHMLVQINWTNHEGWFVGGFFVFGSFVFFVLLGVFRSSKLEKILSNPNNLASAKCLAWNKTASFLNCFLMIFEGRV